MKAESWITIKQVLQEVLNLSPVGREEFLEKADLPAEIKEEVKSLIEFEEESEKFMSVSASNLTGELIFEDVKETSPVGQQIGIYEITEELGIGGMGAVYLAERRDGKFDQKVAVKMLKRELNSEKIRRNFRRERDIQSKLDHPNFARLLDAGTTADGVPYLVMEYVEGDAIDKFCEKNNLPLKARLKLFNKVCEAVATAHRNLIIHRDLKPSNILVNGEGEPKLLDFGISKLLDTEITEEKTAITMLGAMTPEYASPEQLKGETVSTATDIYSLAVVLYKMLTGTLPFDLKGKNNGELLKTVLENEPRAPSAVRCQLSVAGGQKENTDPKSEIRNPKLLRGDIDNIILKALRKEPERRYQTVEQFSADIWRFIDGLPVSARRATFTYRTGKFFRRNKIAVIAGVLILFSLVAGIAVAGWQAKFANSQARMAYESRSLAENETLKAKVEKEKAEKISRFMAKVISYANPAWYAEGSKFGSNARVIDALEDLSGKIDTEFSSEPDVAAELHHKFGEAISWAAEHETGERHEKFKQRYEFHILRALELRKQVYGEWHELVAKDIFYAQGLITNNPLDRGRLLARAIVMMRDTNPNNLNFPYMLEDYTARLIMPAYETYHEPYREAVIPTTDENRYQIAERYLRESLPVFRLHYEEDNSAIYSAECKLAYTLLMQEKWADFDLHYAVCKKYGEKPENENWVKSSKWYFDWIEKAVAEKKRLD